MMKLFLCSIGFSIRHSLFDIRYSLRAHGQFIILQLPTAEGLVKHLQNFLRALCFRGCLPLVG